MRRILLCGLAVLLLVGVVELGVRLSGLVDFPIYDVGGEIGYLPKPDQSGAFLRKNRWVFNDRSMGVGRPWSPKATSNLLLIGNSIVMGGDPYDQDEKLGPLLQQQLGAGDAVWPVGVVGWTNVNETAYLDRNPDVAAGADGFVWECMAGGFVGATPWAGEYLWPRQRPVWAGWYVFRRYVVPRLLPVRHNELPPTGRMDLAALDRFMAALEKLAGAARARGGASGESPAGMLLLYPTRADLALARQGQEWLPERAALQAVAGRLQLALVDVAADPTWHAGLYRADGVHPLVSGNLVLARIIAQAVRQAEIR